MSEEKTFSPPWAPHVIGTYTEREGGDVEQKFKVVCSKCNTTWGPTTCVSGLVRQHIANFALVHVHRDVMNDPFPTKAPTT